MPILNKPQNLLAIGAGLAALAVIFGAFGAHALKDILEPRMLEIFHTGVTYHFYHAFALLILGLVAKSYPTFSPNKIGICFIAGIFLFSGSLYALSLSGITKFGAITPLGGVCFILGWIIFSLKVLRSA